MTNLLKSCFLVLAFSGVLSASSLALDEGEGERIADRSAEISASEKEAMTKLATTDFFNRLQAFSFSARAIDPAEINGDIPIPGLGSGDLNEKYDIIIQPGHYGRKSGKTGAEGSKTSEQKLVAFIAAKISQRLTEQKVKILVVPADGFRNGLKTKIFLAIHADGADKNGPAKGCSAGLLPDKKTHKLGASLGYLDGSDLLGMHSIGFAMAASFGQDYDSFRKDNYTVDEHHYYAFRMIDSSGYGGLLEVGEISCDPIEDVLIARADLISHNLAVALKASVDILGERIENPNPAKSK